MPDDLVSFVILWGAINLYFGNWVPAVLAAAYGYGLYRTDRFDFPWGMRRRRSAVRMGRRRRRGRTARMTV